MQPGSSRQDTTGGTTASSTIQSPHRRISKAVWPRHSHKVANKLMTYLIHKSDVVITVSDAHAELVKRVAPSSSFEVVRRFRIIQADS
jgi:protein-tyrosine-phosphatase